MEIGVTYRPLSKNRGHIRPKMSCLSHWTTSRPLLHKLDKEKYLHCHNNLINTLSYSNNTIKVSHSTDNNKQLKHYLAVNCTEDSKFK